MIEIKGYYTNGDYMGWNGKEWQRYPTEKEYREEVEIENTFQRLVEVKMRNGKRKEGEYAKVRFNKKYNIRCK